MKKPNLFHKIIFRLCKPQMLALSKMPHNIIEPQTRYNDERFEFVFHDENGLGYYIVKEDHDIPIARKIGLSMAYMKFINAVTDADFAISLDAMLVAIEEKDAKGLRKPNIARIGYICTQLKHRKGIILNIELLTELAALYFFREDEAIDFVNDAIIQEKIQHFNANKHLLTEFFYAKSLNRLFPFIDTPQATFDEAVYESVIASKVYVKELENYLSNGR
jgi:hypothetical protein